MDEEVYSWTRIRPEKSMEFTRRIATFLLMLKSFVCVHAGGWVTSTNPS